MNHVRTYKHALGMPLPVLTYPFFLIVMAVGVFVKTRPLLSAPYAPWDITSGLWHEALFPVLAVIAGLAALVVAQVFRRNSFYANSVRIGGARRALTTTTIWISLWVLLGATFGLLPAMFRSGTTATWGTLLWGDVTIALAGVITAVSIGVGLGAMARHWLVAPFVLIAYGSIMVSAMSIAGAPLRLLQPTQHPPLSTPEYIPAWGSVVFHITFGAVTSIAALSAGAYILSHRRGKVDTAATSFLAMAVLVATAWFWRPDTLIPGPQVRPECSSVPEVCVHPAHKQSLPDAVQAVESLRAVAGSELFGPAYDDALFTTDAARSGRSVFLIDVLVEKRRLVAGTLRDSISLNLLEGALPLCGRVDGVLPASAQITNLVVFEIARRSNIEALAAVVPVPEVHDVDLRERFHSMSDSTFQQFVNINVETLRNCSAK